MEAEDDMKTLLSEQRTALMAAKAIDSDLDLAFKMQMQEALTASLFLSPQQPSSSSSSPPPKSLKQEEEDEHSDHISDILIKEIERYEQERRDFELCQAEKRKIKENLSVRLYDHKFASEIRQIPDHDWKINGDRYHKPFGEGSSSSSSSKSDELLSNECFRLYFKGLVVEQRLKAIGVAICDATDNVLLELSKPLMEEREMSGEMVEIEALIEGLNAALALDLKRIVYYCDDPMIHHYVSGRRQPTEFNMINCIKSVNLLHEKFAYCSPLLVARTETKFAFKLARDVISSQLTRSGGSSGKNVKVACSICYEDTDAQLMFTVDGCGHQYCSFCMKQHVEVKLLHGNLPKCPYEGFKFGITINSCQKLLEPKLLEIMSQRVKEATIPVSEKVYCPFPTCSVLMSRSEVKENSKITVVKPEELGASRCTKCLGIFCANCKTPWHSSMTCKEYQRFQSTSNNADMKLKSLATTKKWRQCPKCNNMVELAEGCYHITCRCGHEFCYVCGAVWKNKKPTCSCEIWDERNIIHRPNGMQQRRT